MAIGSDWEGCGQVPCNDKPLQVKAEKSGGVTLPLSGVLEDSTSASDGLSDSESSQLDKWRSISVRDLTGVDVWGPVDVSTASVASKNDSLSVLAIVRSSSAAMFVDSAVLLLPET